MLSAPTISRSRLESINRCNVRKNSQGFTLIELMITVVIFGVIMVAIGPFLSQLMQLRTMENRDRNSLAVQRVSSALTNFSRNTNNGRLPLPYTGNGNLPLLV